MSHSGSSTCSADADIRYNCTRSMTHREGDYDVTDTQHFMVRRAGTVKFEKIPVDASSKMPDENMDSIEPFDYKRTQGLFQCVSARFSG